MVSKDPPKPPYLSPGPGCAGSEWEEEATRARTNVEVSQSNASGLSPACPYRDGCRDIPLTATPRPPPPLGEPLSPKSLGIFWRGGTERSWEKQPRARLPGSLTYPKSLTYGFYITWLRRRLPGCKRAYFPLSFHAALGTGRSSFSPALRPPPRCPFGHVSPGVGRGGMRGDRGWLLPLLYPQIAAWRCQRRVGARGGAGPGLFALPLALPQVCSPPRGFPPASRRWRRTPNVALSPQNALRHSLGLGAMRRREVRWSWAHPLAPAPLVLDLSGFSSSSRLALVISGSFGIHLLIAWSADLAPLPISPSAGPAPLPPPTPAPHRCPSPPCPSPGQGGARDHPFCPQNPGVKPSSALRWPHPEPPVPALAWRRGVDLSQPWALGTRRFRKKPGPRGLGAGQVPKPGAVSHSIASTASRRAGQEEEEEGLCRVISSGPAMLKHLCTPPARREPWQSDAGGGYGPGRRTDRRTPLGRLRSCGRWAQRELPGPYGFAWRWQMTRRSSEHPGAVGARNGLGSGGGGLGGVGRNGVPLPSLGFLQSEKKGVFATQIIRETLKKSDGPGFMRTRCQRRGWLQLPGELTRRRAGELGGARPAPQLKEEEEEEGLAFLFRDLPSAEGLAGGRRAPTGFGVPRYRHGGLTHHPPPPPPPQLPSWETSPWTRRTCSSSRWSGWWTWRAAPSHACPPTPQVPPPSPLPPAASVPRVGCPY